MSSIKKSVSLALILSIMVLCLPVSAATDYLYSYDSFNDSSYTVSGNYAKPAGINSIGSDPTVASGLYTTREIGMFGKSASDASLKFSTDTALATAPQFFGWIFTDAQAQRAVDQNDSFTFTTNLATTVKGGTVAGVTSKSVLFKFNNGWVGEGGGHIDLRDDGFIYFFGIKSVPYNTYEWTNIGVTFTGGSTQFDAYVNGVKVLENQRGLTAALTSLSYIRYNIRTVANTYTDLFADDLEIYAGAYRGSSRTEVTSSLLTLTNGVFSYIPGTSVSDFLNSLTKPAGSAASICKANGITEVADGLIKNGYKLKIVSQDGRMVKLYDIAVPMIFSAPSNTVNIAENARPVEFSNSNAADGNKFIGKKGISGKAQADQSLHMTTVSSPASDIYLDATISKAVTKPITLEYNLNTEGNIDSTVWIRTSTSNWDNAVRIVARKTITMTTGAASQSFSDYPLKLNGWNTISVSIIPTTGTSADVKIYLNGEYLGQGSITPPALSVASLRFGTRSIAASYIDYDDMNLYEAEYDPDSYNIAVSSQNASFDIPNRTMQITSEVTAAEFIASLTTDAKRAALYNVDFTTEIKGAQSASLAKYLVLEIGNAIHYYEIVKGNSLTSSVYTIDGTEIKGVKAFTPVAAFKSALTALNPLTTLRVCYSDGIEEVQSGYILDGMLLYSILGGTDTYTIRLDADTLSANFNNYTGPILQTGGAALPAGFTNKQFIDDDGTNADDQETSGTAYIDAVAVDGKSGKSLKFYANSNQIRHESLVSALPQNRLSGVVVLETSVMIDKMSASAISQIKTAPKDSNTGTFADKTLLSMSANGKISIFDSYDIGSWQENKWYKIVNVLDIPNRKISTWVNGARVLTNADAYIALDAYYVSEFRIQQNCLVGEESIAYFDDVRLYNAFSTNYDNSDFNTELSSANLYIDLVNGAVRGYTEPTTVEVLLSLMTKAPSASITPSTGAVTDGMILTVSNGGLKKEYTVTNAPIISEITLYNGDTPLTQPETGSLNARINITNYKAGGFKGQLILAVYDGNKLEAVKLEPIDFSDINLQKSIRVTLPVASLGSEPRVKAMLFDSFDGLVPLAAPAIK